MIDQGSREPRIRQVMQGKRMARVDTRHGLEQLFGGLVEQVFMAEIGICDPVLTDYVTGMLTDFVHVDRIYRMRSVSGEVIREVSRVAAEAQLGPQAGAATRTRLVYKYIGDFTLFWTGVYPESLRPRHQGVDRFREYVLEGKRSYGIASELSRSDDRPPSALLQQLSEHFEYCLHGLQLVRAGWEKLASSPRRN
jgi:hypothetical protein